MRKKIFTRAEILAALRDDLATTEVLIEDYGRAADLIDGAKKATRDKAEAEYDLEVHASIVAASLKRHAARLASSETARRAHKALRVAYSTQQARGEAILLQRQPSS